MEVMDAKRDWCRICGKRTDPLLTVKHSDNAEHHDNNACYFRICLYCSMTMTYLMQRKEHTYINSLEDWRKVRREVIDIVKGEDVTVDATLSHKTYGDWVFPKDNVVKF